MHLAMEEEDVDLSHLLPQDLLLDEGGQQQQQQQRQHLPLRHTESLHVTTTTTTTPSPPGGATGHHQQQSQHHPPVRKTFSWSGSAIFSLFPKSDQSDLLSSVRQDLQLGTATAAVQTAAAEETVEEASVQLLKPASSNLEEALKSLNLGREAAASSLSRKF